MQRQAVLWCLIQRMQILLVERISTARTTVLVNTSFLFDTAPSLPSSPKLKQSRNLGSVCDTATILPRYSAYTFIHIENLFSPGLLFAFRMDNSTSSGYLNLCYCVGRTCRDVSCGGVDMGIASSTQKARRSAVASLEVLSFHSHCHRQATWVSTAFRAACITANTVDERRPFADHHTSCGVEIRPRR